MFASLFQSNDEDSFPFYTAHRNRDFVRSTSRQIIRNSALARTSLNLSFNPPRSNSTLGRLQRGEPDGADKDYYEIFLMAQIDTLQEKIDETDCDFTNLTRQALDLSSQVKKLEGEIIGQIESVRNASPNSSEFRNLSEIVNNSNNNLNAARSQLTHAIIGKSECIKKLDAYKVELAERRFLLHQHQSKSEKTKSSNESF